MIVVGLTGNLAAGKSAVAELWRRAGVPVASADRFAREAVAPGTAALAQVEALLGPGVVGAGGSLNRAAVRRIVFRIARRGGGWRRSFTPRVRRLRDGWTAERPRRGRRIGGYGRSRSSSRPGWRRRWT